MANGFTEVEREILLFVRQCSCPAIGRLCEWCGKEEEELMPVIDKLADQGFLRKDEAKDGYPLRIKPHPDRPGLLWRIKI